MNIVRNRLHPLRNPNSPLVRFSAKKAEEYYHRTLHDRGMAAAWRSRYFGNLDLPKHPDLFDHGCGRGRFTALAVNSGFVVSGQDVAAHEWWSNLKADLRVVSPDQKRLPWSEGQFDAAFDCQVIGHFARGDLEALFAEMHRVIKPSGYWVLQEANDTGFGSRVTRRYYGRRFHSLDEVISLAQKSGFSVVNHWFEGVQSPIFPIELNWLFSVAISRQVNMSGHTSFDNLIPKRKRRLWVLRLRRD